MIDLLKKHWLTWLLAIIGSLGAADATAGIRAGKSPGNLTVMPSILAAIGSAGVLGFRWLNNRTVTATPVKPPLQSEFTERFQNLFSLARDPDCTDEHAGHLGEMAGDLLIAEHVRTQESLRKSSVSVIEAKAMPVDPPAQPSASELLKTVLSVIEGNSAKSTPAKAKASNAKK